MKTTKSIFTCVLLLIASLSFAAQADSPEYFEGKWNVTIYGTPEGDATIPMRFETKDGVTKGYFIGDPSGVESEMSSVNIIDGVLNAAFNITGYDVNISMSKVDDDNTSGSLLGMFNLEGARVKE
ncbi:hypothetical protein ACFOSV_13625 [Algoriphagus namhaensis]|uniref:Lipocalin-like domain-containing protein n=1 Tax=Algoriphagus namhaensis TaxID=915353 RepID=A0ABV8ATD9_9BACT